MDKKVYDVEGVRPRGWP